MLSRLIIAIVVGVVVALVCVLVGGLLSTLTVDWAVTIGEWLKRYSSLLGLLSALYQFFAGGFSWPNRA